MNLWYCVFQRQIQGLLGNRSPMLLKNLYFVQKEGFCAWISMQRFVALCKTVWNKAKMIAIWTPLRLTKSTLNSDSLRPPPDRSLCVLVLRHLVQAVRPQHRLGDRDLLPSHLHRQQRHRRHRCDHPHKDHVSTELDLRVTLSLLLTYLPYRQTLIFSYIRPHSYEPGLRILLTT